MESNPALNFDSIISELLDEGLRTEILEYRRLNQVSADNLEEWWAGFDAKSKNLSKSANEILKNLVQPVYEGESLVELLIRQKELLLRYDTLVTIRLNLDTLSDAELKEQPFTYNWIRAKIIEANQQYTDLDEIIKSIVQAMSEVEEL